MPQKIKVLVKTRCSTPFVEKIDTDYFKIGVKEVPTEGKANTAAIDALARYLKIPKTRISLKSGNRYKEKIFEII